MNERIKQLLTQARVESKLWLGSKPGVTMTYDELEKFAELIVREMLQTCEDHPTWAGRSIGEQIRQHFGID
jgi:hypothetical protein